MGMCFWFLWSVCALWLNRVFSRKEAQENAKREMEFGRAEGGGRSFEGYFCFSTPWGGSNAGAGSIKLKIICKSG